MKKLLFITTILLLLVGCKKNCSIETNQEEQSCYKTTDLGIDQMSRFSYLWYNSQGNIDLNKSGRWVWNERNDTIELRGGLEGPLEIIIFFKKNDNKCLDFLVSKGVEWEDNIILDAETGEIIGPVVYVTNFYNLDFIVQEYIPNEKLVARIGNRNIWIDFTPDNHLPYLNDFNLQSH